MYCSLTVKLTGCRMCATTSFASAQCTLNSGFLALSLSLLPFRVASCRSDTKGVYALWGVALFFVAS